MKKLKRIFTAFIVGIVMIFGIAGCATDPQKEQPNDGNPEESVGWLYTLQEAYDNGWLTQEDLLSIAYYKNGGRAHNEEIMSESYQPTPKTPEVLSAKKELKIKSAAAEKFNKEYNIKYAKADGFYITRYYGIYGDCVAVMMEDAYTNYACVEWTDTIAGVAIVYGDGRSIKIWSEITPAEDDDVQLEEGESVGWLYSLQDAYVYGWLSREDLMSIAYYHNGGRKGNEEIMSEDYTPQPKTPEVLSAKAQLKIKSAAAKYYREALNIKNAEADGFTITQYCGAYGDCVAVMLEDAYIDYPYVQRPDTIAGVTIRYGGEKKIKIWTMSKPTEDIEPAGSFYTLQEAYDNGLLTQEDLMSIAYYHGDKALNEEIMGESYQPAPKMPEVLSESMELKIKSAAAKNYREVEDIKYAEADGFTIIQYCGTYGDCVAIMMKDDYTGAFAVVWTEIIAGVTFRYPNSRTMLIWRETK